MKHYKETLGFYYIGVEHSHTMSAFHLGTALHFIGKARANIEHFSSSKSKSSNFKVNFYYEIRLALAKLEGVICVILKQFPPIKSCCDFVGFDKGE